MKKMARGMDAPAHNVPSFPAFARVRFEMEEELEHAEVGIEGFSEYWGFTNQAFPLHQILTKNVN